LLLLLLGIKPVDNHLEPFHSKDLHPSLTCDNMGSLVVDEMWANHNWETIQRLSSQWPQGCPLKLWVS